MYGSSDPAHAAAHGDLTLDQVRTALAKQHGFATVPAAGDGPVDPDFEAAAGAIVSGKLLDARPELAHATARDVLARD